MEMAIAVNITYASDGKITMELGKMDSSDRILIPVKRLFWLEP